MTPSETEQQVDRQGAAFNAGLEWIMKRDRDTPVAELAPEWPG